MCAMMPMFRTLSSSSIRGTRTPSCVCVTAISYTSPAIVREGLVGLRHPVDVVLPLVRATLLVGRVENLRGQLVVHLLLAALARERHQPAHGERPGTPLRDLDGNLVVGAADAARPHLEHRRDRLDRALQHLDRALAGL